MENKINMRKIIDYCINDSLSCGRLWLARKIIDENRELSKLSFTNFESCFYKAGGMKVRNTVIGFAKRYKPNIAISNTR